MPSVGSAALIEADAGEHLTFEDESYSTTTNGQHVMAAIKGGIIDATGVNLTSSGTAAAGVFADRNGTVNFSGGSVSTSGANSVGASAYTGGTMNIGLDPAGNPTTIHTTGDNATGVLAATGGTVNATGANVITEGYAALSLIHI